MPPDAQGIIFPPPHQHVKNKEDGRYDVSAGHSRGMDGWRGSSRNKASGVLAGALSGDAAAGGGYGFESMERTTPLSSGMSCMTICQTAARSTPR